MQVAWENSMPWIWVYRWEVRLIVVSSTNLPNLNQLNFYWTTWWKETLQYLNEMLLWVHCPYFWSVTNNLTLLLPSQTSFSDMPGLSQIRVWMSLLSRKNRFVNAYRMIQQLNIALNHRILLISNKEILRA